MAGVLFSESHANESSALTGPLTYTVDVYRPSVYGQGGETTPITTGPGGAASGVNQNIVAVCAASDAVGAAVNLVPDTDGQTTVATADCSSPQAVVGILVQKLSPTRASVQTAGFVLAVGPLTPGTNYYLGHAGALVAPPLDAQGVEYAQLVGQASDDGVLYLTLNGQVFKRQLDA